MNKQATMMNQQQQQQQLMTMSQSLMTMNQMNPHQQQPQMVPMSMSYGMWPQQQQFPNPNANPNLKTGPINPAPPAFNLSLGPRSSWKGKKVNKLNGNRRKEQHQNSLVIGPSAGGVVNSSFNNYNPPTLNELQHQNRLKTRNFFPKKKFNKNNSMNVNMNTSSNFNNYKNSRSAPYAPRNTSSFLIRAKKSGGIASFVSPSPVTPAVLPTPIFSPSKEVLVDMAKEEWGVDGYGSMKGLIRLRSPGHELEPREDEEEEEGGSSESDVEEHVEVERRLDHDLSRFEMIYDPNSVGAGGVEYHNVLENRVDDQDSHISQLEEENLILKERLFLMERELGDLRRRMQCLEGRGSRGEVLNENESENDSGSRGEEAHSMEDNNGDYSEDNVQVDGYGCSKGKVDDDSKGKVDDDNKDEGMEAAEITEKKKSVLDGEGKVDINDSVLVEADKNLNVTDFEGKAEYNGDRFVSVENLEGKNSNENKLIDAEAKTVNNVDESSESVIVEDVCMNEAGVAVDNMVPDNDVVN